MLKKVVVIGAGPGGLVAGLLLAHKGYSVKIYEKREQIGGRNSHLQLKDFKFDLGPTFFLMKDILEEIFIEAGELLSDYVTLKEINPMYKLKFYGREDFLPYSYSQKHKMLAELEKVFPSSSAGYLDYIKSEEIKFEKLYPCLKTPYTSYKDYLKPNFIDAIPYLDAFTSLYKQMGKYFNERDLRLAFTFQAKYIGMSPWVAPGTFSIISYLEHRYGIYHVEGGLNSLSKALGKVFEKLGGEIILNNPVKEILFNGKKAIGIELEDKSQIQSDYVIMNADFATGMKELIPNHLRNKYSDENLDKKKYSCSTFMMYLGLGKLYSDIPHHNIIFAKNYKKNINRINRYKDVEEDFSFYVQNPCVTDKTLAPENKSGIYVLVPVANNRSEIDWNEKKEWFSQLTLNKLERIAGFELIREHIEEIKVVTPLDWEKDYGIYKGAVFNLAHNITQMLAMRPHNKLEGYDRLYIVGGGTHPGSGLPTIYESGRIVAEMIQKGER